MTVETLISVCLQPIAPTELKLTQKQFLFRVYISLNSIRRLHSGLTLFVLPSLQVSLCCFQCVLHVFELSQGAGFLQPGPAVVLVLI